MSHVHGDSCNHSHAHSHSHRDAVKKEEKKQKSSHQHVHDENCDHSKENAGHSHSHSHADSSHQSQKSGGHGHTHAHGEACSGHSHGHGQRSVEEEMKKEKEEFVKKYDAWASSRSLPSWNAEAKEFAEGFRSALPNLLKEIEREDSKNRLEEIQMICTSSYFNDAREVALDLGLHERFSKWMTLFVLESDQPSGIQYMVTLYNFILSEDSYRDTWITLLNQLFDLLKSNKDIWNTDVGFVCYRTIEASFRNGEYCKLVFEQEPNHLEVLEEFTKQLLTIREEPIVIQVVTTLSHSLIAFHPNFNSILAWKDWIWSKRVVQRQLESMQDLHQIRFDFLLSAFMMWKALLIPHMADMLEKIRVPHFVLAVLNHSCHPPPPFVLEECKNVLRYFYRFFSPLNRIQLEHLCQSQMKTKLDLDPENRFQEEQKQFLEANPQHAKNAKEILFCSNPTCQNKDPQSKCSQCKSTFYCSRDCQVADWKRHKKECKTVK